ncbi:MAG: sigma-70 family RNA polymerase sigma factor [Phycisphaerae bacterium]|nr:sigma-70 family RNA polymerase sigma factor [Phycisphaerae bacterium]
MRRTIEDPEFLRSLAGRLARLGVDAEDALADTVAELLLEVVALRFDPDRGTLLDFAAGIGRNLSANRRRRERRFRALDEFPELEAPAQGCPVEEADELERLRAALGKLPARDRELIERRYGVGSVGPLPTPVGGSDRGRLARAREKLRELLACSSCEAA